MTVKELMREYGLEIDDVRWYRSAILAERLLSYSGNIKDLVRLIWSGQLSDELYDMEESFIRDLEDQLERGLLDEIEIRNMFADAVAMKSRRDP